jgi:hypothetical protein
MFLALVDSPLGVLCVRLMIGVVDCLGFRVPNAHPSAANQTMKSTGNKMS